MPLRIVLVAAALALLVVSCSCGRDGESARVGERSGTRPGGSGGENGVHELVEAPAVADAALRRAAAVGEAVDVVQRYLAAAGSAEWSRADALWGYRRAPAPGEEGGLRALMPPRAMRIENDVPRILDDESAPAYVEVPVRLRIEGHDGVQHRYAGWYRLRRNAVEQRWELTAASVSAQMR